jgi:3-hydroxyisobutyrate dehydrogenase-like beta-hydroxyacid dehydrogenase
MPGDAAAVKMLRSVVTKGIEALVVEAMTAASIAGVRQRRWRGICEPMDAAPFSTFVDMCMQHRCTACRAPRR